MTKDEWNKLELAPQLEVLLKQPIIKHAMDVLRTEAQPIATIESTVNPVMAAAIHHQKAGYFKALADLESLAIVPVSKKVPKPGILARSIDDVPADFIQP